jgi:hypothetical protein
MSLKIYGPEKEEAALSELIWRKELGGTLKYIADIFRNAPSNGFKSVIKS